MPKKPDIAITVTAAPRKRAPARVPGKEIRHGAFTRIEDDPIVAPTGPVLLVVAVDSIVICRSYDLATPAVPKSPKDTAVPMVLMVARPQTVAFPNAQGYAFTFDEVFTLKLEAVNLAKPRQPVSTSSFVPGSARQPTVEEGLLYWTDHVSHTINVVDVSNPDAIALIHAYDTIVDFAGLQRQMASPSILNRRLYVASKPNFGGVADGDGDPNSYLATYNFDSPAAATQINLVILEESGTLNSVASMRPPTVLGDAVVYVAFQFQDVPFTGNYTVKLLTFSLANPDAPVQVGSVTVSADSSPVPTGGPWQLFTNKSKTRLFLFTQSVPVGGTLRMYDITAPSSPVLLDSLTIESGGSYGADIALYASATGFMYRGNIADGSLMVYRYSDDVFELVNTIANASPLVALDKRGFPQ